MDADQAALPPIRSGGGSAVPPDRVAAWARTNANTSSNFSRPGPRSAPSSNYAPSSFGGGGGGTIRRKLSRRITGRSSNRVQSSYEEEEGYASGDYEDVLLEIIRVKASSHVMIQHWRY